MIMKFSLCETLCQPDELAKQASVISVLVLFFHRGTQKSTE